MAKALVEKAKEARKKRAENDDDFFVGVERDDDTREIMEDLKKEKVMIFHIATQSTS